MKQRKERWLWISVTTMLTLLLTVVILVPTVSAQTRYGSSNQQTEDYIRLLRSAFFLIQQSYIDEVSSEELFEGAMKGILENLDDPYSLYLTGSDLERLTDTTKGQFGGVGLYISKDLLYDEDKPLGRLPFVEVVAPIEGTPAYRAGIHAGDYIFAIDGTTARDLTTEDVSDRLRGKPGTDVTVTILRGGDITFDVIIERAIIEIPTVREDMIGDYGYLRIIQFTPHTAPRVREALRDFQSRGYKGLIIDLRNNPGGLLDSVVEIGDFFFDEGVIVSTRSRIPSENHVFEASASRMVPEGIPIAVLIDEGSASASEILTGAIKDRERGVIIGRTSYGKGSVQSTIPFSDGMVKLTIARYYTPGGFNIDKSGIDPDIEVVLPEFSDEETESYRDLLENNTISMFIENHTDPSEREINTFISSLIADGNVLERNYLKLLIRSELNRRLDFPPAYDLEFDETLQTAVDYLTGEE